MSENELGAFWGSTSGIGLHEGRELELMLSGRKPLSMFYEEVGADYRCFPEAEFDALVSSGRLKKAVALESILTPDGREGKVRRVMYALPEDEWRMEAMRLVLEVYDSLGPGWRPDLERVIGTLLGYDPKDIEAFVERVS